MSHAKFEWVKQNPIFNTGSSDRNPIIVNDTSGNIYCSYFFNSNPLGQTPVPPPEGGTNSGNNDIVVFKLDKNGNHMWNLQSSSFNTIGSEEHPHIAMDNENYIYNTSKLRNYSGWNKVRKRIN
jgi:hypothetical protein